MGKLNNMLNNLRIFKEIDLNNPIVKFTNKEKELIQYIRSLDDPLQHSYSNIGKHFGISKQAIAIRIDRILEKTKKQRTTITKYNTLKNNITTIENNITELKTEYKAMCDYLEKLITRTLAKETELFYAKQQYIDFMKKEGGTENDFKIY